MFEALLVAAAMMGGPVADAVAARGAAVATPAPAPAPESEHPAASPSAVRSEVIGRSLRGRAIRARVVGDPAAPVRVLVVGCVHGDECAGLAILRRLRSMTPPAGVSLWTIDLANPDGTAADTRGNARGVDLNRNFPYRWRPLPRGTYYSGRRPLSEPEGRALHEFLSGLQPAISIWYHQHADLVDESGGDVAVERRYARLVGMRFVRFDRPPGSITSWQNATFRDDTAFVVELPAGPVSAATARRHARAVLTLAREAR